MTWNTDTPSSERSVNPGQGDEYNRRCRNEVWKSGYVPEYRLVYKTFVGERTGVACMETEEAYVIGMSALDCYAFHQWEMEINKLPADQLAVKVRLAETPWANAVYEDQVGKCGHCHTCPK